MAGKAHISGAMVDVLALLLQAWEDGTDVHGLMIMRSVRRSGPAVYKVLDRLEDLGWIDSHWEVLEPGEKRPRRRYYRLSASGAESARRQLPVPEPQLPRRLRPRPEFGLMNRLGALR
jgi:DNA-binding PadR family transcriptional regulator